MSSKLLSLPNSANPGKKMPAVGFGTWQAEAGEVEKAVETALKVGYKHIDCAAIYGNENEVGEGIRASGVDPKDIWITSKLWNNSHDPKYLEAACDKTLQGLGLKSLDLYLLHWPFAFQFGGEMRPNKHGVTLRDTSTTLAETWSELEKLLAKGKVKNIGISNFTKFEIQELLKTAKHRPDVIQIELHPYLQQKEFVEWCQMQGMVVTAYSPFGNQNPRYGCKALVRDDPVIKQIAENHGKTPNQMLGSWGITRNTSVIPKSTNEQRIKENLDLIELTPDDMARIERIDKQKRFNDPSAKYGYVFFADEKADYKIAMHEGTSSRVRAN